MGGGLIFLDRQHAGKPHSVRDRGAWGDLDQDGKRDAEELEALLTAKYLWHAERCLIEMGHSVLPICDGAYYERHARVRAYAQRSEARVTVYVAAHLNAGGGRYGACFHDYRSSLGPRLADAVADQLEKFPELTTVKVLAAGPDRHGAAWSTIRGVFEGRPPGLCFEPAFLDQRSHEPLFTDCGLRRIGDALARGIDEYVRRSA